MNDPFYPEEKPKRGRPSDRSLLWFSIGASVSLFFLFGLGMLIFLFAVPENVPRAVIRTPLPTPPVVRLPDVQSDRGVLAFSTNRQNAWQIHLIDAYGEQTVGLNDLTLIDTAHSSWSPDGRQLAFQTINRRLGVIGADGMREYEQTGSMLAPAWSPDGTQIAYTQYQDASWDLYVITLDTESIQRLTFHPSDDAYPSWSPNGDRLVFTSKRDGNEEIYLIDTNGENVRRLTDDADSDRHPVWSPDSTQIAFSSNRNGSGYDLWVMNANGTDARLLVESEGDNIMNDWSPNGTEIAFSTNRDGNWEIYLLTIASGELRRLTNNDAADQFATWRR
ncbi:MAG: hypothetical protein MUF87_10085 [Anaerolineae bacterium]|jgi:Tol biopolymer transport system component|nr:hypothetical protein [Anaerolineae bacterium]